MKWRLRELGGKLVAQKEPRNIVLETMSLLTVAKNAGLISDANFEIIHREFGNLVPNETLGEMFYRAEASLPEAKSAPDKVEERLEKAEPKPDYIGSSIAHTPPQRPIVVKDKPREDGVVSVKKNSRQTTILTLLKKKNEIIVGDVTPLIPGVSEKTIQRELLAMVAAGILRKIGEKRWSRYTLAE
ncbi:hypothetical protein KW800_00575 [Candidatus Parcubacteria bacterium]|nr:hypothetical protein [Candidatus Parcubacteria bacterium]